VFSPEQGRRPPFLAGRDAHLEHVSAAIAHGGSARPFLYSGRVLTGRTSLLAEVADICRQAGWRTLELESVSSSDTVALLAGRLGAEFAVASIEPTVRSVVDALQAVPQTPGLAIVFDDVDAGSGGLALIGSLGRLMQSRHGLIVAASCLPSFSTELLGADDSATWARHIAVGPLSMTDGMSAVYLPAKRAGIDFSREAAESIARRSKGVPAFIQLLAHHASELAGSDQVTLEHVEAIAEVAGRDAARSYYAPLYESLTSAQQRFMRALHTEGDGAPFDIVRRRLGEFAGLDESSSPSRLVCNELIAAGHVYTTDGNHMNFSVAAYGAYVDAIL
jgi:hypothetical protein